MDSPTSGVHESFLAYSNYSLENIDNVIHPEKVVYDVSNDLLEFNHVIQLTDPRLINKGLMNFIKRAIRKVLNLLHEK